MRAPTGCGDFRAFLVDDAQRWPREAVRTRGFRDRGDSHSSSRWTSRGSELVGSFRRATGAPSQAAGCWDFHWRAPYCRMANTHAV